MIQNLKGKNRKKHIFESIGRPKNLKIDVKFVSFRLNPSPKTQNKFLAKTGSTSGKVFESARVQTHGGTD